MPGIEELHFEVILDKDKFQRDVEAIQKVAANLNSTLTQSLNLTKSVGSGISGMVAPQTQYTQAVEKTNTALTGTSNIMRTISQLTGVAFGVVGLRRFTTELIQTAGAFEVQKAALSSMLQDAEKAGEIFDTLRQKALESPYTFQDLTKFAKQLIAFNIPADQLVETERRLADVAAGLGVDMGRIILAYGQVKAAGALKGTELRQFTEAGVPILEQLAKQIEEVEGRTVSLSEVFNRITKKQIPFEMVEEAFKRMTDEGGKFYNMQEVLVETLSGKISKLRDVWQQALYDLGNANSGFLKGSVDAVTVLVQNLDKLGRMLPTIIASMTAFKAAQIALEVGTNSFALANHKVLEAFTKIGTWIKGNPYALLAAAVAAVTVEAIRFGRELYESTHRAEIAQRQFAEATSKATSAIVSEREELRHLAEIAGNELETMEKRQTAIDVINAQYSSYLKNLGIEKVSVDNLATSYNALSDAIANKYLAELKEQTVGVQQAAKSNARASLNAFNAAFVKDTPITIGENKGKHYGPGGMGLIQGEIERFINEHPMFDQEALTNAIANIYRKYGLEIANDRRKVGDLYRVVSDYVEAARLLNDAERDFNNFAKGYGKSLGDFIKTPTTTTTTNPNTWGNDWKPLGGDKDKGKKKAGKTEAEKKLEAEAAAAKKAQEEVEKYLKTLEQWTGKEKALEGTGLDFKISKAIADYRTAMNEAERKYREVSTMPGSNKLGNIQALLNMGRDQNGALAKLRSALVDYAGDYYKEVLTKQGYDLTNWNDKTLGQIRAIRDALAEVELPEWLKKELEKQGLLDILDEAEKKLEDGKKKFDENTLTPEQLKKEEKSVKNIAKYIKSAGDALKEFGNAADDSNIAQIGENLSMLAETWSAIVQGAQSGGIWGAIIAGLATVFTQAMDKIAEFQEALSAAKKAAEEAKIEAVSASFAKDLEEGIDTVFGENLVKKMKNAVKGIDELRDRASKLREEFEKIKQETIDGLTPGGGGGNFTEYIESERERLRSVLKSWQDLEYEWSPEGGLGRTPIYSLREIADKLGMSLLDENNNPNAEFLKEVMKILGMEGGFLQELINYSEDYIKAAEQMKDVTSELFDTLSSDLTDKFIDNFKQMGDAVYDLGDIFEDLGETILRSFLQSFILDNILKKYEKEATGALSRYATGEMTPEQYAAWLAGFANNVKRDAETLAPAINGMIDAFADRGLIGLDEGSSTVSGGIKSITEETASLLASYINAMRADLSVVRGLQERGWNDVSILASSVPTLNDYLQQIAATNFDIAQSNQSILSELRSVIGAPGTSGSILRVELS